MKRTRQLLLAVLISCGIFGASSAQALVLPDPTTNAYQYGDFYSYSLPILAYGYDQQYGGGVGPGTPYYIASSPGQIANTIVVATKSKETNFSGMDNAYLTPNGSGATSFSTGSEPNPGQLGTVPGNQTGTWDSSIAAFKSYLNGTSPAFMFNNNETKEKDGSGEDLLAWARLSLRSSTGAANPLNFDFTNNGGLGGIPGGNVANYTSTGAAPVAADYVLSGGQVTLPIGPGGTNVTFDHNLGANQAAYAIVSPELNEFLATWDENTSLYDVLSIDLRLNGINNGYEQLFVVPSDYTPVPEPGTMMLLGMGMLGLAVYGKRRLNGK